MPLIRERVALAASGTNANAINGNRFEFLPTDAIVRVFAVAHDASAATTANTVAAGVNMTISLSNVVLLDNGRISDAANVNRNEHQLTNEEGAAGDRLIVSATNSDAANGADVELLIDIVPV